MARIPGVAIPLVAATRLIAAAVVSIAVLLGVAGPAHAETPTLAVSAYLDGNVRPGAWAAVRVEVSNDGPDVQGELRIRTSQQGLSVYGVEADLPSGARKEFVLYAQPPIFGSRLIVELVSGDQSLATAEVPIRGRDASIPLVGLIAERPEAFQRDIETALRNPNFSNPIVALLQPADLPERVEAWAALDRLVWQDVDTGLLTDEQLEALQLWINAGGQLVIVGGTTGPDTLRGLPPELLPFVPERTVDVPTSDLAELLGSLPQGATSLPALAGTLRSGAVLGRSGDHVYAARLSHGQGAVTVLGINPAASWLARSDAAGSLWRRALPMGQGQMVNPFFLPDEASIFHNAISNLPAVALPPIEQLFVLLLAYIVLIGPVNYLVLRRLDRREWAWLTMPVLVVVFAVGSYAMGAALKGSDVIVNEVAIVRAGQGATRGIAQVYVGVFSPSRRTFEVSVPGGALLSSPASSNVFGGTEQPIDALMGNVTSRIRNFEVGFGVIRGFRADTAVDAPAVRADLRLVRGHVEGTLTNGSDTALEHVAIVFGGNVMTIPNLAPGETKAVDIAPTGNMYHALSERIFGTSFSRDPDVQRKLNTRRTVIDQLTSYGPTVLGTSPDTPLVLAWQERAALDVGLAGERPNRVGDSLYVVPVGITYDRQAVFDDSLIVRTIVDQGSEQGWGERNSYSMDRGILVLELRPAGLAERFDVTKLELAVSQGGMISLRGSGAPVAPLPDADQPPQDDPLGEPPEPGEGGGKGGLPGEVPRDDPALGGLLPAVQLFDHRADRWYEFPAFADMRAFSVTDPSRWVDDSGRLLIRFVNRGFQGEVRWFQLQARIEGTIR
jgi:hypothetical protein